MPDGTDGYRAFRLFAGHAAIRARATRAVCDVQFASKPTASKSLARCRNRARARVWVNDQLPRRCQFLNQIFRVCQRLLPVVGILFPARAV